MSKFIYQAVRVLDKLYGFDQGPTATDQLNLGAGIQLVHDTGRGAEIASGVGKAVGWFDFQSVVSHAVPGALASTFTIQTTAQATGLYDPYRHDLWLFDTVAQIVFASLGTLTNAMENTTAEPLQSGNFERILKLWNGEVTAGVATRFGKETFSYPRPVQLFYPGALLINTVAAVGAIDVIFNHLCWIGAKGALPPHVA